MRFDVLDRVSVLSGEAERRCELVVTALASASQRGFLKAARRG